MNWLFSFSPTEVGVIGLFIVLYAVYFIRTLRLARQLRTTPWSVVPKFVLRSLAVGMLLIALMGPLFGEATRAMSAQGRDVFVLLDVSRSMDATDVAPTRLERAKFMLQQLTDSLVTDRFGLILVSDQSYVLSPLTSDHQALNQLVQAVRSDAVGGGTNLCEAINLAKDKMVADSSTQQRTRAIVLLSDGENFGSCPPATLSRLVQYDIALFAAGIGTDAGSVLRNGKAFLTDEQGQLAHTRLNRDFLRSLIKSTSGQYHDLTDHLANDLATGLRSLPGRTINQRRVTVTTNKYYYFLGIALFLVMLDVLVTVRTLRL
ncbi:vWA domain-containing protein [Fibrivirga algicola]|uniref:VWA domain-containing protein n=1 Tax=Fibrivirga algicola TaxID=2950420 RepID=A0ABX0QC46_9BACT|nr:VWA domain-containing protein [Fibrivirga algicola]NID09488.1 VWA domain-containing protein [Fibrivirga algicola]